MCNKTKREIGGYIELDEYSLPMMHSKAIALNCARNALAYIIRARGIETLYVPFFLCSSIKKVCERERVTVKGYSINSDFKIPSIHLGENEWLYFVNYYGQFPNCDLVKLKKKYDRIIVDNVQAYFQEPVSGIDTLYSCRKYFGVPDGAFVYCDKPIDGELDQDYSFTRMEYLLGRFEKTAERFYPQYVENDLHFENEPIKKMSKLTCNLLHGVDYEKVVERRNRNFSYLHARFYDINRLQLHIPIAPYMYPLYIDDGDKVRKKLLKDLIYVPTLWIDVCDDERATITEKDMALNILPLPIDQRYTEEEMDILVGKILEYSK